jgi:tRNA pseudouridine38-40 synthase
MVRNLVGVLLEIGRGEQPVEWARHVLESRDRTRGGVTAPAEGLYMWSVDYPAAFGLPAGIGSVMIAPHRPAAGVADVALPLASFYVP